MYVIRHQAIWAGQIICKSLKAIANSSIDICIVLELAKEGVMVSTKKYVGPSFHSKVIGNLIVNFWSHVNILVSGTIIGKQRAAEVLVHEQLGNAESDDVTVFVVSVHIGWQIVTIGVVMSHPFEVIL